MDITRIASSLSEYVGTLGYELVSYKVSREKGNTVLALVVDRVEPIDMNAITEVSEKISAYLDTVDDSETSYVLDVSSLGAEKPLKVEQLDQYVGRYVNVHLDHPIDGENIYEGTIREVKEDSFLLEIRIKTRVKTLAILKNNIYKIRLAIQF